MRCCALVNHISVLFFFFGNPQRHPSVKQSGRWEIKCWEVRSARHQTDASPLSHSHASGIASLHREKSCGRLKKTTTKNSPPAECKVGCDGSRKNVIKVDFYNIPQTGPQGGDIAVFPLVSHSTQSLDVRHLLRLIFFFFFLWRGWRAVNVCEVRMSVRAFHSFIRERFACQHACECFGVMMCKRCHD